MSIAYRFYCHDCKVRTTFEGDHSYFLINHSGHRIEYTDFAKHAAKPCDKCYQPEYCEGDCYKLERST